MRELYNSEIKVVSGAGIITQTPVYEAIISKIFMDCASFGQRHPLLSPVSDAVKSVVNNVVNVADIVVTDAFYNLMDYISGDKKLPVS